MATTGFIVIGVIAILVGLLLDILLYEALTLLSKVTTTMVVLVWFVFVGLFTPIGGNSVTNLETSSVLRDTILGNTIIFLPDKKIPLIRDEVNVFMMNKDSIFIEETIYYNAYQMGLYDSHKILER